MKIDLNKLANGAIRLAGPVLLAAFAHKLATGRFDLKKTVLSAAGDILDNAIAAGDRAPGV